jgi:hypothetical protein
MAQPTKPPDAPTQAPSAETLRRAKLCWEQALADLAAAARMERARAYLECGYLSLQAALNALTAICYLNGEVRPPSFSPVRMAALCAEADPRFAALHAPCAALEAVQERGPFDPAPAPAQDEALGRSGLEQGQAVLALVRSYLKEQRGKDRRRCFAP